MYYKSGTGRLRSRHFVCVHSPGGSTLLSEMVPWPPSWECGVKSKIRFRQTWNQSCKFRPDPIWNEGTRITELGCYCFRDIAGFLCSWSHPSYSTQIFFGGGGQGGVPVGPDRRCWGLCPTRLLVLTARCTIVQSAVWRSHVARTSVCMTHTGSRTSVYLSVTFRYRDHIG